MNELELAGQKLRWSIIFFLFLLCAAVTLWSFQIFSQQYSPVDPDDTRFFDVVIPEKSSARQVAAILKKHDLINSEAAFLAYCRKKGIDDQLKAGHYRFSRSQSLGEIAENIAEGRVVKLSFTVPEGYTVEQIGQLMIDKGICTEKEWEEAISAGYDFDFLDQVPSGQENRLEGFLFPDTYVISEDASARQVINLMLANFAEVWNKNFAQQAKKQGYDVYEVIIKASMIEREAMVEEERKTIAGVIENRLEKGMPLQIDATVLYSLHEHKNTVTYEDLEVDSPYNTYKYAGLPPGPIACPGKASIEAALNPENHHYYYYVSKGDGSHYFSRTYAEHLQAMRKYSN